MVRKARYNSCVIHFLRKPATPEQVRQMLETLGTYIKVAVDVERGVLAGGGVLHADCEAALLEDGGRQEDIWGADWNPSSREVQFESLINIRPKQKNPSLELKDPQLRQKVEATIRRLFEAP